MKHYLPRPSLFHIVCIAILAFMCAPMAMAAASAAPAASHGSGSMLALAALGLTGMILRAPAGEEAESGGKGGESAASDVPKLAEEFAANADPSKMSIAERIRAAGGIVAKGDAYISKMNARIADHEKAIAAKDKELAELKDKLQAAEKRVTELEAEAKDIQEAMAKIETEAKELRSKEESIEKRAEAKAGEKLGALGFPSSKAPPASDKPSADQQLKDLRVAFKAETDPEKKGELAAKIRALQAAV